VFLHTIDQRNRKLLVNLHFLCNQDQPVKYMKDYVMNEQRILYSSILEISVHSASYSVALQPKVNISVFSICCVVLYNRNVIA